ncbi:TolC family outer membrane protein [Leeia oryzae]|uniref:TolC family outer membrane protein n=1 Tax=Leeia oryzae TaxID=356662 RepID=UPI000369FD55|nr:TolC family outer membrane protein [Leeia oryzae]
MFKMKPLSFAMLLLALGSYSVNAKPVSSLKEAAEAAVLNNPEVLAKWHDYSASVEEQGVARSGYFPKVDLTLSTGREHLETPTTPATSYNRNGGTITLRQMIFDGLFTPNQVKQLGYVKLAKYYDLLSTTDDTVLEVTRAYLDVLRYRKLVELAKDNYAIHKGIFGQIEDRVKAGVGRRVDLEQASGRMALAESNWLTDASNLHDVTARFQRLVGELPADNLADASSLTEKLPKADDVLQTALNKNPAFLSAVANIRAARADLEVRKANNLPTLEFRASRELYHNTDGVSGAHKRSVVELVLNYNLFNGGGDSARARQFAERVNTTLDLRDKACRDIRQTVSIAWNDVSKLKEQLNYLEQHQLSTEKARDAYRKQFDIGQRTLLDLLDTENELFDARRALSNAEFDYQLAQARVLATNSALVPALNLTPVDRAAPDELGKDASNDDDRATCGDMMPAPGSIDTNSVAVPKYTASTSADGS